MPRLAIAQIRPTKGEYAANLQRIGGVLAQLAKLEPAVDLVVFPETATSGYFVEGGVRDVAVTAGTLFRDLSVQHEAAQAPPWMWRWDSTRCSRTGFITRACTPHSATPHPASCTSTAR